MLRALPDKSSNVPPVLSHALCNPATHMPRIPFPFLYELVLAHVDLERESLDLTYWPPSINNLVLNNCASLRVIKNSLSLKTLNT